MFCFSRHYWHHLCFRYFSQFFQFNPHVPLTTQSVKALNWPSILQMVVTRSSLTWKPFWVLLHAVIKQKLRRKVWSFQSFRRETASTPVMASAVSPCGTEHKAADTPSLRHLFFFTALHNLSPLSCKWPAMKAECSTLTGADLSHVNERMLSQHHVNWRTSRHQNHGICKPSIPLLTRKSDLKLKKKKKMKQDKEGEVYHVVGLWSWVPLWQGTTTITNSFSLLSQLGLLCLLHEFLQFHGKRHVSLDFQLAHHERGGRTGFACKHVGEEGAIHLHDAVSTPCWLSAAYGTTAILQVQIPSTLISAWKENIGEDMSEVTVKISSMINLLNRTSINRWYSPSLFLLMCVCVYVCVCVCVCLHTCMCVYV